jgi:hypothetical protein
MHAPAPTFGLIATEPIRVLVSRRDAQTLRSAADSEPDALRNGQAERNGTPRDLTTSLHVERPYYEPGLLLGTSAFTAVGWEGSFYPPGMKPRDFLPFYSSKFATVELNSTFYGTPSASTVTGWYEKTPPDFIFAAKVPQVVTHTKLLVDCEAEFG